MSDAVEGERRRCASAVKELCCARIEETRGTWLTGLWQRCYVLLQSVPCTALSDPKTLLLKSKSDVPPASIISDTDIPPSAWRQEGVQATSYIYSSACRWRWGDCGQTL